MIERSDEELLAAWQSGDEAAFDSLYGRWRAHVRNTVRKKTKPHDIDDVCQNVWIQAFRYGARKDPTLSFKRFLTLSANRAVFAFYYRPRGKRAQVPAEARPYEELVRAPAPEPDAGGLAECDIEKGRARLNELRAALSPRQLEVFEIVYIQGEPLSEAARRLGIVQQRASEIVFQIRKKSVRVLGVDLPGPTGSRKRRIL